MKAQKRVNYRPTPRQFLSRAAIFAVCGGVLVATVTASIEAYASAYGPKSGHGDWSTLLSMMVHIPAGCILQALHLDYVITPTTRFGQTSLIAITNGFSVIVVVMLYAIFLVLGSRALDYDNDKKDKHSDS